MAYWLFKSEPGAWSWDAQVKRGAAGEPWNGVRNYQANNNMKAMRKGDLGFFYHSVDEKRIVGIVEVIREHHPDPTDDSGRFGLVTVRAVKPLPNPVTLAQIKAEPRLADMALVRQSRLSVTPVDEKSWSLICKMGGLACN
ncbi:MAG: EVE domain-containing protein [Pseudomonadota bacterium]